MFGAIRTAVTTHTLASIVIVGGLAGAVGAGTGLVIGHPATAASTPAAPAATIPTYTGPHQTAHHAGAKKLAKYAVTAAVTEVASETGMSTAAIQAALGQGQTLAQIAGSHAATVEAAVLKQIQAHLTAAKGGSAQSTTALQAHAQKMLDHLMKASGSMVLAALNS